MSCVGRWLLLESVILQISNLEAILYSGHFFIHPVDINQSSMKRTPNSVRSQTSSEISASGSKTLRHTLTGHYSSSGPIDSEDAQKENKVCITSVPVLNKWYVYLFGHVVGS